MAVRVQVPLRVQKGLLPQTGHLQEEFFCIGSSEKREARLCKIRIFIYLCLARFRGYGSMFRQNIPI